MWPLIIFLIVKGVISDEFYLSSFSMSDRCGSLCKTADLPNLEDNVKKTRIICERGCRLFNIIQFKDNLNMNMTKEECYTSCDESYVLKEKCEVCRIGCDLMLQHQKDAFKLSFLGDEINGMVLSEPDLEILDTETINDPSIQSQLQIGYKVEYKIPETYIRTMPIKSKDQLILLKTNGYSGDWLDCAARNSGIPRWILLTAILSAVLLALWLSFSSEKKSNNDEEMVVDGDISDEKFLLEQEVISELEKDSAIFIENEVDFSSPPKYDVENKHV